MITDYGVKGLIGRGLRNKATPMSDLIDQFAPTVTSNVPAGSTERLDFLGAVPALRKWVQNRQARKVIQSFQTAKLEKYESTVDIPLDLIRNDKTGQVGEIVGGLSLALRRWKSRLLFDLLNNGAGTTLLAFDGLSFFNDAHIWNGQAYDNNLTHTAATGTIPTANEAADAICEAIQQLYSFVDDQGEPINEDMSRVVIVTSPTIGNTVMQAVKQNTLDTGTANRDNPVKGWASTGLEIGVIVSPRYTNTAALVAVNASDGAAPLVFLENEAERMITSKAAGSDYEHDNDAWQYGVKAVGVGAYGRFTDAVLQTFT